MSAMTKTPVTQPVLEDLDKEARAIESLGLRYQTIEIPLDHIDIDGSETFNQRFEGRSNEDVILQYALDMERGAQFPKPTVFFDSKARKYKLVSGVHRTKSRKLAANEHPHLGLNTLEVFEVIISPPGDPATMAKIEDLGFLLNTTLGYSLSEAERYAAAIRTMTDREVSIGDVANQFGLNIEKLEDAFENYLADKRLLEFGLDPASFTRLRDKKTVITLPDTFWMHEAEKLLRNHRDAKNKPIMSQDTFYSFVRFIIVNKDDETRKNELLRQQELLSQGKQSAKRPNGNHKSFPVSASWRRGISAIGQVSPVDLVNCTKTADSAEILRDEIARTRAFLNDLEKAVDSKWPS